MKRKGRRKEEEEEEEEGSCGSECDEGDIQK